MSALLRQPSLAHLEEWRAALLRGWSPSNSMPQQREKDLAAIEADPQAFLAARWDPDAAGPPVELPDGSLVPRLPSLSFVIWSAGFAGLLNLRYCAGTTELPATCLGHIGYGVVPWRRGEGLAARAVSELRAWLPGVGLPHMDAAILPDNQASQRVMQKAGAAHVADQQTGAEYGHELYQIWRIGV